MRRPIRINVVSGYFNPLHRGHLDMILDAKKTCDYLFVIVNNDKQQMLKKGKIIMPEIDRLEIVEALKPVSQAFLAEDEDLTVCKTIERINSMFCGPEITFCNGGDRKDEADIPEAAVCKRLGWKMMFGIGGNTKADSSTRINQESGYENS